MSIVKWGSAKNMNEGKSEIIDVIHICDSHWNPISIISNLVTFKLVFRFHESE